MVYSTPILIENNIPRALVGEGELRSPSNLSTVKMPPKGIWNKQHPLCPHTQGCLQHSFQVIFLPIPFYNQFQISKFPSRNYFQHFSTINVNSLLFII